MRALVTGVAGFIGSHLVQRLLAEGSFVRGIDAFTPYYDPAQKRSNVDEIPRGSDFELIEGDLNTLDLRSTLVDIDVVFHLAGQPGVRLSCSSGFSSYVRANIEATQRLLEAARESELARFVYASSSSVYGNAERYPTTEDDVPAPLSPYGVTKLAAEHLCVAYAANDGVPTVSLRYFTVYGPRQRPDMAFHRAIEASLGGEAFEVYGGGDQVRDFTYVGDVVSANIAAVTSADVAPGDVYNVAGGGPTSLNDALSTISTLAGEDLSVENGPAQRGDVGRTGGSTERAQARLGWRPTVDLYEGLRRQVDWHRARRR